VQTLDPLAAWELDEWRQSKLVLDVRETHERSEGFIPGSISIPLPELAQRLGELDRRAGIAVHCRGGYRSAIASSLLQAAGFEHVVNVTGGFDAWELLHQGHSVAGHR
jgi:rhodanese-related sulfurtransferase